LGLAILIAGALVLNEFRRGLVEARKDSLTTQGELMATIIDRAATVGEPQPMMNPAYAGEILQMLANPKTQRARLFDAQGNVVADSDWVTGPREWKVLPPAQGAGRSGRPQPRPGDAQAASSAQAHRGQGADRRGGLRPSGRPLGRHAARRG
jgi:two-component system sensor histidine kinase ChvG